MSSRLPSAVCIALLLACPCYAGGHGMLGGGYKPSAAERLSLALCVAVYVASLVEAAWSGQRWYRPFLMAMTYVVVAVWRGDRGQALDEMWWLLIIAVGVWAASTVMAKPVQTDVRCQAATLAGVGAAILCAAMDRTRHGVLSSEYLTAMVVLLLWIVGLFWVTVRGIRNWGRSNRFW